MRKTSNWIAGVLLILCCIALLCACSKNVEKTNSSVEEKTDSIIEKAYVPLLELGLAAREGIYTHNIFAFEKLDDITDEMFSRYAFFIAHDARFLLLGMTPELEEGYSYYYGQTYDKYGIKKGDLYRANGSYLDLIPQTYLESVMVSTFGKKICEKFDLKNENVFEKYNSDGRDYGIGLENGIYQCPVIDYPVETYEIADMKKIIGDSYEAKLLVEGPEYSEQYTLHFSAKEDKNSEFEYIITSFKISQD